MNLIPFIKNLRAALITERDNHNGDLPTGLLESKEIAVAIAQWFSPDAVGQVSLDNSKLRLYDDTICKECGQRLNTRGIVFCSDECFSHHSVEMSRQADLLALAAQVRKAEERLTTARVEAEALRARLMQARGY